MHRLLLLPVLLLINSPLAAAQEPDSIAAYRYLALEVDAEWQYQRWEETCPLPSYCEIDTVGYLNRRVAGDSLVGDQSYRVLLDVYTDAGGGYQNTGVNLVRYDSTEARAFQLTSSGKHVDWPNAVIPFPCALDLGEGFHNCGGEFWFEDTHVWIEYPWKEYFALICTVRFLVDIGLQGVGCAEFGGFGKSLIYANVGGIEYGEQVPVSSDPSPAGPTPLALAVFPNPAPAGATVSFTLPAAQEVTLEVFDLLGRRVRQQGLGALPAGEHDARLALEGLPAGVFVVRLTGDAGAVATVRLVRQRGE